jgi:GT2 family glycosyltransferase
MSAVPQCAVVIPTFNGAHLLSTCLEALLAHPAKGCDWRVIVVDDASSDGTVERFRDHDERVTVVSRERNGGFAEACNDGARAAADADHLVFLNNDTVPLAGWLDALVEAAAGHPEAAAIGSKLLFPDGTVQHAGVVIGQDRWPHHIYAGFPGEHPAVSRSKRVTAATAACLLVRRRVFEDLGGFDTAFHNGYEDVDLCLRLGEQGHEVRYCAGSVLYHLESVTRWADESMRHSGDNDRLYAERWQDRIPPDDIEHYLADGVLTIEYGPAYPLQMSVSPLLAAVQRETGPDDRLARLLSIRTNQLQDLQARRTRAALEHRREEASLPTLTSTRRRSGGSAEVVSRGEFQRLGAGPLRQRVSVLMPLMNAGPALRRTLPLLLEQDAAAELEIVAIDSASSDDTVDVLEEFGATVLAIDPAEFDHGLTRNLLASHARGEVLVFLNGSSRPCDRNWLAPLLATLDADPTVAGACSRVLPHPDADPLTQRDVRLDPSGSPERSVKRIADWDAYMLLPVEERRLLLNFHTVSTAIRADVLRRIPFQSVRAIGEDLLWAREVLESGMALVHEAGSCVYHSHDYSLREWLMRNVDDGIANRDINSRSFSEHDADALVRGMIASDWAHLRDELGLEGEELERWQIQAALRRTAQSAGQWLGVNHTELPQQAVAAFSAVANVRRNAGS